MPEFFGLCGRYNPRPCKLIWSSTYPNQVGTYPADLLPARRTIWHAVSDGGYMFSPPVVEPGFGAGLGTGILGGFTATGILSVQYDTFQPQTHISVIFARTANRINMAHIVTQAERDYATENDGVVRINVGEYIFEAIAVTDEEAAVTDKLTDIELERIKETGEAEGDRAFRKLFEQTIPNNRLIAIERNDLGIEYRLDNGSPKSHSAFNMAGRSNLRKASYRDGTSKVLLADLGTVPAEDEEETAQSTLKYIQEGDTVYLTYVAIKEHYMRQCVEIAWTMQAISLPPQCFGFPRKIKVSNYRFYNWEIQPDTPDALPVRLGGWRVVESFNIPVNMTVPIGQPGAATLSDFVIGGGTGEQTLIYLDVTGDGTSKGLTQSQLQEFISNRATATRSGKYSVDLDNQVGTANYQDNKGRKGSDPQEYKQYASWYSRRNYSAYTDYNKAIGHVFFNTHRKALAKRDVDKFGIERYLAQEIEEDIKNGRGTFFPFMDDSEINDPLSGSNVYLDGSNTKFEPIQPLSRYTTSNAEIDCGVGGGIAFFYTSGRGDVLAVFGFTSNIITERFEKDTRVLVERHFTMGSNGPDLIAVEGVAGARNTLSCIGDPSYQYAFSTHVNDDEFIIMNSYSNPYIKEGLRNLTYRPDLPSPPIEDNNNPVPDEFEKYIGYSGKLGDRPGFSPGLSVSISHYADDASFLYKTTSKEKLMKRFPNIKEEQIENISFDQDDKITISLGDGYYGCTEIDYEYTGQNFESMFLFKSGNDIESTIDSVSIRPTNPKMVTLQVNHQWLKGDTLEIVGSNIRGMNIQNITVHQLSSDKANDFLNEESSSSETDKEKIKQLQFIENSLFFKTDVMSIGEDFESRLFIFFNDSDNGISCVQSNDFGDTWHYHYGVIEAIEENASQHPFVLSSNQVNMCFLFYLFHGKIMCKAISYSLFGFRDALLIERFEKDRYGAGTEDTLPKEKEGLFSNDGDILRRKTISFAAAGDLTDKDFLKFAGKNTETNESEPTEEREVDSEIKTVRKYPIAIGSTTAYTNYDFETIYFSAYRTDNGRLALFFLGPAQESAGGGMQLQCHFSIDNGVNWYDMWEYVEYGYDRLRTDEEKNTQFIDRNTTEGVGGAEGDDPEQSNQEFVFGINVHWSRLDRDKKAGDEDGVAESKVLEIEAPYVFYQSTFEKVFLFYIYEGCLLCKVFADEWFSESAKPNGGQGMSQLKEKLEQETYAYFVDGNLESQDLRDEIIVDLNVENGDKKNIIFTQQFGIEQFNGDRTIPEQRVCAYEMPNGNVRVFYRHENLKDLRATIWNGSIWMVEDLLKSNASDIDLDKLTDV